MLYTLSGAIRKKHHEIQVYTFLLQDVSLKKPVTNGIPCTTAHCKPGNTVHVIELQPDVIQPELSTVVGVLHEQLHELQMLNQFNRSKESQENVCFDWMMVAMVLDRLFLVFFILLQMVITLGVLLKLTS